MKNLLKIGALGLGLAVSATTFAATTGKIGVVDMKQILTSAPQMKSINAQLKNEFSKRKESILSQAKVLQSNMADYGKNKAVMSASKANDLKTKISNEEQQLRTEQMRYQQDLMAAQNKAMSGFLGRLKFAVTKVASKQGLAVVFPKNNLLYANSGTDITSAVLDNLK